MRNNNNFPSIFVNYALNIIPLLLVLAVLYAIFGGDDAVNLFFRSYRTEHPLLTKCIWQFTHFGNPAFYLVYILIFAFALRKKNSEHLRFIFIYILVQIVWSMILLRLLKITVGRPRPQVDGPFRFLGGFNASYQSMPSGHTTEVLISSLPFALLFRKYWLSLFFGLYSALMGFSRIYVDMHYPSDVLGGIVAGSIGGIAIYKLFQSGLLMSFTDRITKRLKGKAA